VGRVLITGAAGFIGSHLTDALERLGHDVFGIDNYATGRSGQGPARMKVGSVGEVNGLDVAFRLARPDVVIHCAAAYKDPDDWAEAERSNVLGTANVVDLAKRHGVARLAYFQTSLCYGLAPEVPVTVDAPLRPRGCYAVTKTLAEQMVREGRVPWLSFRLANVYGPRNLSGPVPAFYRRLSRGEACTVVDSRRDFIYVADLVRLVVAAMFSERTGVYHVATGRDAPIVDVFEEVAAAMRVEATATLARRGPDDAETILLDPSGTRAAFGWSAETRLERGVAEAVRWYEQHGVDQTFTHLTLQDEPPAAALGPVLTPLEEQGWEAFAEAGEDARRQHAEIEEHRA